MKDLKFKKQKTKLPALGVLFLCGGEATRHSLAVLALTIFAFTANCRLVLVGCWWQHRSSCQSLLWSSVREACYRLNSGFSSFHVSRLPQGGAPCEMLTFMCICVFKAKMKPFINCLDWRQFFFNVKRIWISYRFSYCLWWLKKIFFSVSVSSKYLLTWRGVALRLCWQDSAHLVKGQRAVAAVLPSRKSGVAGNAVERV